MTTSPDPDEASEAPGDTEDEPEGGTSVMQPRPFYSVHQQKGHMHPAAGQGTTHKPPKASKAHTDKAPDIGKKGGGRK